MAEPRFPETDEPATRFTAGWWLKLVVGAILTVAVGLGGLYVGVRYLLWPNIDRVAGHYASTLGERLGAPLRWTAFTTEWTGWRPSLTIAGVSLGDGPDAVHVDRIGATIALRPMLTGQVAFHRLAIDGPTVPLVRDGERVGLALFGPPSQRPQAPASLEALGWLLQQPEIRIGGGTVTLTDVRSQTRPLRLAQVAAVLRNGLDGSDLRLDIARPDALAANVALQGKFSQRGFSEPADWANGSGDLRVEVRQLAMEKWRELAPDLFTAFVSRHLPTLDGSTLASRIDPTVTASFNAGRLQDLRVRLRGDRLDLAARGQMPVRLSKAQAELRWVPAAAGGGELTVGHAELVTAEGARLAAPTPSAIVASVAADGQLARLQLSGLDAMDVEPTLTTVRRLLPDGGWLAPWRASGRVSGFQLDWRGGRDGGPAAYAARGSFERASIALAPAGAASEPRRLTAPLAEWSAMHNVSGQFEATAASGQVSLRRPAADAEPTSIRFAGVFAEPDMPFNELDAKLTWLIDHAAGPQWLSLRIERFAFANEDARGSLSGRFLGGERGSEVVDVRGRIDRAQANRVWRYLPVVLNANVRDWVRQAFPTGSVEGIDARWSGPLTGFPYRLKPGADPATAAAGQFRVAAKLRDVLFQYANGWPAVHGIHGDLVFERAAMRFTAERARVMEVPISQATARIDDLTDAVVEVTARARGDAAQFLKFVTDSPLGQAIGGAIAPISVAGAGDLDLTLNVPVRHAEQTRVGGRIDWGQGRFALADSGVRLDEVDGTLTFSEKALEFDRVAARLYGQPVDLSGRIARPGVMHLKADGRADTAVLRGLVGDHPFYEHLRGSAPYQAQIDLGEGGYKLRVDSDLVGLASRLPAPMAKSADAPRSFSLTLEQRAGQPAERIVAALGSSVALLAERRQVRPRTPMKLTRAAIAVNRPPVLPDQGVSLQVTEQRVDLDEWIATLDGPADSGPSTASPVAAGARPGTAQASAAGGGSGPSGGGTAVTGTSDLPVAVNVVTDELRVSGRTFNRVLIGASRDGDRWNANIAAREINGHVSWTGTSMANGKLTARLGRLEIPQSDRPAGDAADSGEPTRLPALDITADRFVYGGFDLGSLSLLASNPVVRTADRAWTIDRLRLTNPGAEFDARGSWQKSTALDYTLKVIDAGQLLERFQIQRAVKGGSGTLSGRLEWPGSPVSFDRSRLDGILDIAIKDGQFLKVEPGAAKLIGVLNLQALPKLLSLDFKDIFGEGFAFSELQGQARIHRGVATTDSLAMRGLQAVVQIKGEADLKAQTQNLRVVVLPELNGGLATLAFAALVNPAVGLGALLAQSVLSQPLSRAFAYEVDVTGPWANPTVVERRRERFGPPENQ